MGRNLSTDLSRPKLEVIRPSEMSPLEMITACLCFRIQETVRNRLNTHCRSLSIEVLFKTLINIALSFSQLREVLLIINNNYAYYKLTVNKHSNQVIICRKLMIQLDTRCSVPSHHGIPLSVIQENVLIAKSMRHETKMLDYNLIVTIRQFR